MTTKNKNVIAFPATVEKVQTLADGGIRITLDLPEDAIAQAAALMACKREGIPLKVEVKADGDA
ncbi:MAG: hypothetical protein Q8L87_15410 [Anaerolineales bacterium]|nr:hypothetical protein [Anaerolineales bacterium]